MKFPATLTSKLAALLLAPLLLSACATAYLPAPMPSTELFSDAHFGPPSEPVGATKLFDLSPAMRQYVHSPAFASQIRSKGALHGLVDALYQKGELKLEYESSKTRNAAETFEARAGNCLSLVIMTAAFARELGLPVQYQNVMVEQTWSRAGNLYFGSNHVNLTLSEKGADFLRTYATSTATLTIDFLRPKEVERFHTHPLEETDIVAMYMNNRAAEALAQDRMDDAYWWAREAVKTNPRYISGYNTLAVIYQRRGNNLLAEQVFSAALQREPENTVIMHNMIQVLAALGKDGESKAMKTRLATIEPFPPFYYFNQGIMAMEKADYQLARNLFAKEVKRAPFYHEFHFWLAIAHWRLGEGGRAQDELKLAMDTSTTSTSTQRYSAKLSQLRSGAAIRIRAH
ncbi:MAG: tetratricopeptide repeat protein [Telluria sp.]